MLRDGKKGEGDTILREPGTFYPYYETIDRPGRIVSPLAHSLRGKAKRVHTIAGSSLAFASNVYVSQMQQVTLITVSPPGIQYTPSRGR